MSTDLRTTASILVKWGFAQRYIQVTDKNMKIDTYTMTINNLKVNIFYILY